MGGWNQMLLRLLLARHYNCEKLWKNCHKINYKNGWEKLSKNLNMLIKKTLVQLQQFFIILHIKLIEKRITLVWKKNWFISS